MIGVGIIGFGTVGTGTYRIIREKAQLIREKTGVEVKVVKIADIDLVRPRGMEVEAGLLTRYAEEVLEEERAQLVVELIGGVDKAYDYIVEALRRRKWVVTANKALLCEKGDEIFALSEELRCEVGFEASVCGGIPLIKAIRDGLVANTISQVMGILNGTTNYILTRMTKEGIPFSSALAHAREQGFAEKDASLDVEGIDTAHKLCVLARLALQFSLRREDMKIEGISRIEPIDIEFAKEFGYTIKLLGVLREREGMVEARVEPTMIPLSSALANVDGVFNGVYVVGDKTGPTLYYGKGAGAEPTGSAVVSDIVDMAKRYVLGTPRSYPVNPQGRKATKGYEFPYPFYVRLYAEDRPGVLSKISGILAAHDISISAVIQKGRHRDGYVPIVMVLHETKEEDLLKAKREMDALDILKEESIHIRIEKEVE